MPTVASVPDTTGTGTGDIARRIGETESLFPDIAPGGETASAVSVVVTGADRRFVSSMLAWLVPGTPDLPDNLPEGPPIPLVIRYGTAASIRIEAPPKVLDALGTHLRSKQLTPARSGGTLELTGDIKALTGIIPALFHEAEKHAPAIRSIILQLPVDPIRDFDIIIGRPELPAVCDVLAVIAAAGPAGGTDTASLPSPLPAAPLTIPLILIAPDLMAEGGDAGRNVAVARIDDITARLMSDDRPRVIPGIPVVTDASAADRRPLDLLWQAAEGYHLTTMRERLDLLAERATTPPEGIVGLLRRRSVLAALAAMPDIATPEPVDAAILAYRDEIIAGEADRAAAAADRERLRNLADRAAELRLAITTFLGSLPDVLRDEDTESRLADIAGHFLPDTVRDPQKVAGAVTEIDRVLADLDSAVTEAIEALAGDRRDLARLVDTPSAEQLAEMIDECDNVRLFWSDVVPATMKTVVLAPPNTEVTRTIEKTRREFTRHVELTPYDEEEFEKCLKRDWPPMAKQVTEDIDRLLNDTAELWRIKVEQCLASLEEFRRKNLGTAHAFETGVQAAVKHTPSLSRKLTATVPRKPGIFGKILASKRELEAWHDAAVSAVMTATDTELNRYRTRIGEWIAAMTTALQTPMNRIGTLAAREIKAAESRMEEIEGISPRDDKVISRLKRELAARETAANARRSALKEIRASWNKVKSNDIERLLKDIGTPKEPANG